MVGTAPHGQLIATRDTRLRFAIATPADDGAIRRLLRDNATPGAISVGFEREPDYFRGSGIGGAEDTTIVAYANGVLVCVGRCSVRPAWVNGHPARVGYLGELRLDRRAQGRWDVLRGGYRFFEEIRSRCPADVYFTSIAADNQRARRLLERGLPGLPRYEFLTELTTLLIPTWSAAGKARNFALQPVAPAELAAFLERCGRQFQLAAAWTEAALLSLERHDLPMTAFSAIRERGEIVAVSAFWDQRRFRQTRIHNYSPTLRRLRPLANAIAPLIGTTPLPPVGSVVSHAFLSPLAIAPGRDDLLASLIAGHAAKAAERGIAFVAVALPCAAAGTQPLRSETLLQRQFRCRTYATRLYSVSWPGDQPVAFDGRPFAPDVALL